MRHSGTVEHTHNRTWSESVLQVGHQVVLLEHLGPAQVGEGQIGQRAQTLHHKLLILVLTDLSRQLVNMVLTTHTEK